MREKVFLDSSRFDFLSNTKYRFMSERGFGESQVIDISKRKNEPEWMLKKRLQSFKAFSLSSKPGFGVSTESLDLSRIISYLGPDSDKHRSWDDVPQEIRETFEKLGIPEAERESLAGVGAQFDSEIVYQNIRKELEELGIVFLDMETAVKKYPELVRRFFMKAVPPTDHRFAALHGAVWSGGSFVYVPKGVKVPLPLQAYFRMNVESSGQFEHTLIIADEGSDLQFIEGCSAPRFNDLNLHVGMVEIFVLKDAKVRYSTIQNWSKNTYNLNTKRAIVEEGGTMEWISGSLGSMKTMLYPSSVLRGRGARAEHLGITYAGPGQHMDTGSKVIHLAPDTSSLVDARSISVGGGWAFYRGFLDISRSAMNSRSSVKCTALMIDNESRADTVPIIQVMNNAAEVGHEARIGRLGEEEIFYLMSRGLSESEAKAIIVRGFMEPVSHQLPVEYAVELNRLIDTEMESSIG
ncbi:MULTISPECIES: Fe-S cluster assembly protein SufB [Mesotoga]|jgi:Fe-S cluster assembly protein SufB|uniref:FeS assembly protein SufB n=2 Tax=Mesotoga TaxID=1184396 RepID=I2F287_9BACT|nr:MULTISPECIES: Fe-S cluster assembly protein SufB [Mesotoga]MCP5456310.1 Fe-S cluster assembly protein SufB [Thermotogota bacterium]AFK06040.1 FeS assembly protein SufB [Mesotoga prima MesG1.Ag.4.2]MCP5460965.1 Fe-S cluster assembly protein SufB [Thermotogota bacterium]MDK2944671.1 Fe-S cluster assembly protein SufB [Mesotoga sp.]RLL88191.1 Fe-S cluster assembly protein SufB [Mesotoga sp. H07pep.5.4]